MWECGNNILYVNFKIDEFKSKALEYISNISIKANYIYSYSRYTKIGRCANSPNQVEISSFEKFHIVSYHIVSYRIICEKTHFLINKLLMFQ